MYLLAGSEHAASLCLELEPGLSSENQSGQVKHVVL